MGPNRNGPRKEKSLLCDPTGRDHGNVKSPLRPQGKQNSVRREPPSSPSESWGFRASSRGREQGSS